MRRCLELAQKGLGDTGSNPLVGAVIVHDNHIIGEGYHQEFGKPHAEVNAVNSVKDKSLLSNSKIYVSLEPCSHFGKTPPCANLIVDSKIPEVIICNLDPNEKVSGRGIKLLEDNGIKVTKGILNEEGNWLNRRFFSAHKEGKPYVILKWAQNQDGLMDKSRTDSDEGVNWITQPETKTLTHTWRTQEQAILLGYKTVLNDSPRLDSRYAKGNNPLRVVIDLEQKIPSNHKFYGHSINTLVFSNESKKLNEFVEHIAVDKTSIEQELSVATQILTELHSRNILSVIIEGGAGTLAHFIKENLWNEARILTAENSWTSGLKAPKINGRTQDEFRIGKDHIKIIVNK